MWRRPLNSRLLNDLLTGAPVQASKVSKASLKALESALASGILVKRTLRAGGSTIQVENIGAFRDYVRAYWPSHFGELETSTPRAANIAASRNSKAGATTTAGELVFARAHTSVRIISTKGELSSDLGQLTRDWGAFCFLLEGGKGPDLQPGTRVMTIENRETFLQTIQVQNEADLFIDATGRMSHRLLNWLHAQDGVILRHWGDFDPTGLQEFFRLLDGLEKGRAKAVELFVPGGVEDAFRRFANRALLESPTNAAALTRLPRGRSINADQIIDLIHRYGPLEQEAFLIRSAATKVQ